MSNELRAWFWTLPDGTFTTILAQTLEVAVEYIPTDKRGRTGGRLFETTMTIDECGASYTAGPEVPAPDGGW